MELVSSAPMKLTKFILKALRYLSWFVIFYGIINTIIITSSWQMFIPTTTGVFFRFGMTLPAGLATASNAFCIAMIITYLLGDRYENG